MSCETTEQRFGRQSFIGKMNYHQNRIMQLRRRFFIWRKIFHLIAETLNIVPDFGSASHIDSIANWKSSVATFSIGKRIVFLLLCVNKTKKVYFSFKFLSEIESLVIEMDWSNESYLRTDAAWSQMRLCGEKKRNGDKRSYDYQ